ncbi:MAG: hypothetical protein OEW19_04160 [Acidobacteriota bacterium]|nr:hypothetical protein [Acidobacteriota bacterium]
MHKSLAVVVGLVAGLAVVASVSIGAQNTNPRFGKWQMKTDNPPPFSNIMTYEPFGEKGMKITVESVNAKGEKSAWWYTTNFDGKDMPVTGQENAMTSVRQLTDRINEIINKRDGKVTTVLYNILSADGDTIANSYMRDDGNGKTTNVTYATYVRMR